MCVMETGVLIYLIGIWRHLYLHVNEPRWVAYSDPRFISFFVSLLASVIAYPPPHNPLPMGLLSKKLLLLGLGLTIDLIGPRLN